MKRKEILELIDETYNNIYAFTDRLGDEALNVLDEYVTKYNLDDEYTILIEALCDDYDPTNLSKDTLSYLLDAHKDALANLRCE